MIISNPRKQLDLKIQLYHQTDQNPESFFYFPGNSSSSTRSNTHYFSNSNRRHTSSINKRQQPSQEAYPSKQNTFLTNVTSSSFCKESPSVKLVPERLIRHPFNKLHRNYSVVKYISQQQEEIVQAIQDFDFEQVLGFMVPVLEQCVKTQEVKGFMKVLKFLGDFALYAEQSDQAVFLFHQGLIISEHMRLYLYKIKFLIRLSETAKLQQLKTQKVR